MKIIPTVISLLITVCCQLPALAQNQPDFPPNADLTYKIKARQSGLPLSGSATVRWQQSGGQYSIVTETRAILVGKILDASSHGKSDQQGLVPEKFYEKRFGKDATTTRFDHVSKTIQFSAAPVSYPIKGGEQDRTSATWQLINLARSQSERFIPGSEWKMFVAGRRDAEDWSFKVLGKETIATALGEQVCLHISKAPPPDSKDQQLEIWLAPDLDWYPVRLKFSDADGDYVDQVIEAIKK